MAEEWLGVEAAGSDDEEEEQEDGERRHQRLLEAVSSLSGRRRRKLAERTEASAQVSEFNVSCKGAEEKLVLSELLEPIRPKSALCSVKKELNRVKQKAAVELPLSKEEAKRVVREAAYDRTSKEVGKWQEVVLQHRRAEQLVFPLKQDIPTVVPLEQVVSAWKARTPLEQEIFGLLHKNQQPITDPLLTPEETAALQAMSLEEARQRRAELQKARAIQSYYEAKARREKRIKSKKYHRVLKKSKRRKALKEFELLQKSDPEAALAKLEELEQLRMQERMSLKHQNKGKWARSRAIMAKYDLEARKAMQEQLARNKELTQKVQVKPPEEPGDVPEEDPVPLTVPSALVGAGGANPWMLGKPSSTAEELEVQEELGDVAVPGAAESKDEMSEEEEVMSEEEALLQDFAQKRQVWQQQSGSPEGRGEELEALLGQSLEEPADGPVSPEEVMDGPKEPGNAPVPPVEMMRVGIEQPELAQEQKLLSEQLDRVQTMEEVEALASKEHVEEQERLVAPKAKKQVQQEKGRDGDGYDKKPPSKRKKKKQQQQLISLRAVLAGKPQQIQCPSLPIVVEEEEGGIDQRGVIAEAFAGDDVVADFRREKRKAEEASKPQPVNLVLPGWGEWGGTGLKPSVKKRKRFLLKAPPAPPRKDQHMPHVIMSEKRNIHAAAHQVNELPFPFERHQQFEQSIRMPLGATWNTLRAFQKLTAPRVITRIGHIIQPLSAEDVTNTATASSRAKTALEVAPKRQERPLCPAQPRGKRAR
ncbi:UT14A protein, partial [Rhinopomastus cyanomelas]|nr:UT14A protein [Rhinopomastus cyanomelas]